MSVSLKNSVVLDLTEGAAMLGPKLLADLGADVIKIEKPGGSPSRNIGPFFKDSPDPEKSLFWFAYNSNKRGITLDIESPDGQEVFRKLAGDAAFVFENFEPGYLERLGLGYERLNAIHPRIIMASITPYGATGPKSHYQATELTVWASSGQLYVTGDADRPPVQLGPLPHAAILAGLDATMGALFALWHSRKTGRGQHVVSSMQRSSVDHLQQAIEAFEGSGYIYKRIGGRYSAAGTYNRRIVWPCKDGHVCFHVFGGGRTEVKSSSAMVQYMHEEGMAPDWLVKLDWIKDYDASKLTQERVDTVEDAFAAFLLTRTRRELFDNALKRGILLSPLNSVKDLASDTQLNAREFFTVLPHPELGEPLKYCAPFVRMSENPARLRSRAPLIGEHNTEVYSRFLPAAQIALLKESGVI